MRKTSCHLTAKKNPRYCSYLHIKVQKNNDRISNNATFIAGSQKPHYIPENKVQPVRFLGCATAKPGKSNSDERLNVGLKRNISKWKDPA